MKLRLNMFVLFIPSPDTEPWGSWLTFWKWCNMEAKYFPIILWRSVNQDP